MGQIFNLHEAHVCVQTWSTKSALGVSDYQPARLSPSVRHSLCARRHQPPCKKQKGPLLAPWRAARNFFPQLAVGVTWWLLLLYTPHREWWYYSLKRVESAHRRSWNGMMYGPRIINHSFTRGCHPAVLQPFGLCVHLYIYIAEHTASREMNASGCWNRGCHNFLIPRARSLDKTSYMITQHIYVRDTPMMSYPGRTIIIQYTNNKNWRTRQR